MRISELSRSTAVPVPTIKYYMREQLLHPGTAMATNQADYDAAHVHRLRLIRILIEVGGLSVTTVKEVLDAVDNRRMHLHRRLGVAHHALGARTEDADGPDIGDALADVDRFLVGLGWRVSKRAPARRDLAGALAALRRLGWNTRPEVFVPYARAAGKLAEMEIKKLSTAGSRASTVEQAIVGTVVFEAALLALRRLGQEHHSALRFAPGSG
jgi:DNA-binding transcriptional MerR regulator